MVVALKRLQVPVSALEWGASVRISGHSPKFAYGQGALLGSLYPKSQSKQLLWLFASVSFSFEQFMHAVFYNFMVCGSLHVQYMFVTKGRNLVGLSREYGVKLALMRTGR